MTNTAIINSQDPAGAFAVKPVWARLDNTGRHNVIALAVIAQILLKCRYYHPCFERDGNTSLVQTKILVGQTEDTSKDPIKVRADAFWFAHNPYPTRRELPAVKLR